MAENTETENANMNSFPDLEAVIKEQQTTIKTLQENIEKDDSQVFKEPLFNTTPTQPQKPKNILLFLAIGVIIFLILRRK